MQGYPGAQYAPPQYAAGPVVRKSRTGMIVGICLGGVVLAVIVGAVVWGIMSPAMELDGPWYHQVSEEGGYEADFPRKPHEFSEPIPTPIGSRTLKRAQYMTSNFNFEVSYFDMGDRTGEMTYDYNSAARAMAEEIDAVLAPGSETRRVGSYEGRIFTMQHKGNRKTKALLLRRGDRVYVVLCENYRAGQQASVDRFIDSFQLINNGLEVDSMRPYRTVGNYWTQRVVSNAFGDSSEFVTIMRYEVVSNDGRDVTLRTTTQVGGDSAEPFSSETVMHLADLASPITPSADNQQQRETITTSAGEFDCVKTTINNGGSVSHSWTDRKTGLLVRLESLNDGKPQTSIEMTECSVK